MEIQLKPNPRLIRVHDNDLRMDEFKPQESGCPLDKHHFFKYSCQITVLEQVVVSKHKWKTGNKFSWLNSIFDHLASV